MRTLTHCAVLLLLASVHLACAHAKNRPNASGATVSGEIRFVEEKTGHAVSASSGAAVWLVPANAAVPVNLKTMPHTFRMLQHNKQFQPHLLVVPIGSVVQFPNLDPWFHNVFSLYRGKRFDLGLYEAGSQKSVRFDRPGPSYIFCNIHPEMMAVVLTVESRYYAITSDGGRWSVDDVPPGRYRLHVWYENATAAALRSLSRELDVGKDGAVVPVMTVPVTPHDWLHHENLYGRPYESRKLSPVY